MGVSQHFDLQGQMIYSITSFCDAVQFPLEVQLSNLQSCSMLSLGSFNLIKSFTFHCLNENSCLDTSMCTKFGHRCWDLPKRREFSF